MIGRWSVRVCWEPRDLWVGVYWDKPGTRLYIYVCVIPCVPIKFTRWAKP